MADLPELDWFQGRAEYLVKMNEDRDEMFDAIDQAIKGEWDLDEELEEIDWVHKSVDPSFAQTVEAATRILDDVDPEISIQPYDPELGDADISDEHEKGVRWLLDSASRRRATTTVQDAVAAAVRYSETAFDVVYIPQQIKDIKAAGGNPKRYEAIMRHGPFAIVAHNPRNAYARHSDLGLEESLIREAIDVHDVIDLYGTAANDLKAALVEAQSYGSVPKVVTLNDYLSYDHKAVWVEFGDNQGKIYELVRKPWEWPFLPRVHRIGGTNIEKDTDHSHRPILANMYHFDLYDTMNRVRTMRISDMIRAAGKPRGVFQSDTRKTPEVDASSGELYIHTTTDENLVEGRPWPPDPSLAQLYAELMQDHQSGTLSRLLLGGEIPSGAAYASINLVTHSALAALKTPRRLASVTLEDIIEAMLLWIHYTNDEVVAYYTGKDNETTQYLIRAQDIKPTNLYVSVNLRADLPTDSQARTVTARAQIDAGINSRQGAMEDIGITNATETQEQILEERLLENMIQIEMRNDTYMADMQLRDQIKQQMLQDPNFVQQVLAMAQQGMAGPPGVGAEMQEPPGMAGTRGINPAEMMGEVAPPETLIPEEANPAMGGPVPAEFNPEATRELQTQRGPRGESTAAV